MAPPNKENYFEAEKFFDTDYERENPGVNKITMPLYFKKIQIEPIKIKERVKLMIIIMILKLNLLLQLNSSQGMIPSIQHKIESLNT